MTFFNFVGFPPHGQNAQLHDKIGNMKYQNITPYRRQTMGITSTRSMKKNKSKKRKSLAPNQNTQNMRETGYFEENPNFPALNPNFPMSPATRNKSTNQFMPMGGAGNGYGDPTPTRKGKTDRQDRQRFNSPNKIPWRNPQKQHSSAKDLKRNHSNFGQEPPVGGFNPLKMSNFSRKHNDQNRREDQNQVPVDPNTGYPVQGYPDNGQQGQQNQNDFRNKGFGNRHGNTERKDNRQRTKSRRHRNKNMAMSMHDFRDMMGQPPQQNPYGFPPNSQQQPQQPQQPPQQPQPQHNYPQQNFAQEAPQAMNMNAPGLPPNQMAPLEEPEYQKPEPQFLSPQNYARKVKVNQYQNQAQNSQSTGNIQYQQQSPTTMNGYLTSPQQNNLQPKPTNPPNSILPTNQNSLRGTYYNNASGQMNQMRNTVYLASGAQGMQADQGETTYADPQANVGQAYTISTADTKSRRATFAPGTKVNDNFLSNATSRRETIAGTPGQKIQMYTDANTNQTVYTIIQQQQPQQQQQVVTMAGNNFANQAAPILDPLVTQRNKDYSYDGHQKSFLSRIAEGNFNDPMSPGYVEYINDCGVQIQAARFLNSQVPNNVIRHATPVRVPFTTTCKKN